jgi:hypothetical protein
MSTNQPPRILTHDERKAADAAFAGRPFDASWSKAARLVYEGILAARDLPEPAPASIPAVRSGRPDAITGTPEAIVPSSNAEPMTESAAQAPDSPAPSLQPRTLSREEAIQGGALIDVTPIAHKMGLRIPVAFSRPLWDLGITATRNVPEEEFEGRVRDVLLAFRLRLAGAPTASPVIEFPALLAFPPDPTPQTCLLFAVAQADAHAAAALTFLLPGEVSTGVIPFNRD